MKKLLFDNNFIDIVVENFDFFQNIKSKYEFHISSSVVEELAKIPDSIKEKRIETFLCIMSLEPKFVYDSVFVLDDSNSTNHRHTGSRLGFACLGDAITYNKILKESGNNTMDARLADTAISNSLILLTEDIELRKKIKTISDETMTFEELKDDAKILFENSMKSD